MENFQELLHKTTFKFQKPKASQLENNSEPLKVKDIKQENYSCFFISLNYGGIII
jgi:hypothetical protein